MSVDCQWTDWGNWSRCSATCDGGTQTRSRQFLVSAQYGGEACVGDSVQMATCNSQSCPEVDTGEGGSGGLERDQL